MEQIQVHNIITEFFTIGEHSRPKTERNTRYNVLRDAQLKGVHRYTTIREVVIPESGEIVHRNSWAVAYPADEFIANRTLNPIPAAEPAPNPVDTLLASAMVSEGAPVIEETQPPA